MKICVFYEGNINSYINDKIRETAYRYKAKLISDFEYENMQFQACFEFSNEGQVSNFRNDLKIIGRPLNLEISMFNIY